MKFGYLLCLKGLVSIITLCAINSTYANNMQSSFNEAMNLGKSQNNQAGNVIQSFDPYSVSSNYTSNPSEVNLKGNASNLGNLGMSALNSSEVGKTINSSTINNPKVKIDENTDFMKNTDEIRKNANVISGMADSKQCVKQVLSKTNFTSHYCEKDNDVSLICNITAKVRWKPSKNYVDKKYIVPFEYFSDGAGFSYINNNPRLRIKSPVSGTLINYRVLVKNKYIGAHCSRGNNVYSPQCAAARIQFDFFGKKAKMDYESMQQWKYSVYLPENYSYIIGGSLNRKIKADEYYYGDAGGMKTYNVGKLLFTTEHVNAFYGFVSGVHQGKKPVIHGLTDKYLYDGQYSMELTIRVPDDPIPEVYYDNSCSESSLDGAIKLEEVCVVGKGNRDIFKYGKNHSVYADCWQKKERYIISEPSDNECRKYDNEPNCTIGERECVLKVGNDCVRHRIKYQCSKTVKTDGYVCGDKFFCSDGSCADLEDSVNSNFGHAVSQLATLAKAGEDYNYDKQQFKAFSGRALYCRKSGFGFSDCCKDGGWGQSAGLAQCNGEEQMLGQAKEKKTAVFVGTFCSRKVLGRCIQRKSSYCVFDNKLARITQVQGRSGQLGIGFGGATNPDCRGLTVEELQNIDFNAMDYSDFYDDLNSNTEVPDKNQLMEYMRKSITEQMQQ